MKDYKIKDEGSLPDFFVTAMTLDYRQRIDMQSVWQEHIDASISATVNVPNSFTVEETERLYLYAYERGLKGITIFRDGCKREMCIRDSCSELPTLQPSWRALPVSEREDAPVLPL